MPTRATVLVSLAVVVMLASAGSIALGAVHPSSPDATSSPNAAAAQNHTATDHGGDTTKETDNATIQVTASAQLSAQPDMATVRLAIVSTADSADTARQQVAENASQMRTALDEAGVDAEDVRTTGYDIGPVYNRTEDGRELVGYRAIHAFEVDVTASPSELGNRTGEIIDTAVANGASRIDGVQFTLSEETRRELRTEALEQAMGNAREDADVIAEESDLTITGVRAASTGDFDVGPVHVSVREEADSGGTTLQPGPVTVSATVSVTYGAD